MTEYKQPKDCKVPDYSGYPNKVKKTQTTKIQGTKLATKGTNYNSNHF